MSLDVQMMDSKVANLQTQFTKWQLKMETKKVGGMPGIYTYLSNICMKYSLARFQAGRSKNVSWFSSKAIITTGIQIFVVCSVVCFLYIGHMANNLFAVCTHGKDITHRKYMLCCMFFQHTTQKYFSCRVLYFGTQKSNNFFVFSP